MYLDVTATFRCWTRLEYHVAWKHQAHGWRQCSRNVGITILLLGDKNNRIATYKQWIVPLACAFFNVSELGMLILAYSHQSEEVLPFWSWQRRSLNWLKEYNSLPLASIWIHLLQKVTRPIPQTWWMPNWVEQSQAGACYRRQPPTVPAEKKCPGEKEEFKLDWSLLVFKKTASFLWWFPFCSMTTGIVFHCDLRTSADQSTWDGWNHRLLEWSMERTLFTFPMWARTFHHTLMPHAGLLYIWRLSHQHSNREYPTLLFLALSPTGRFWCLLEWHSQAHTLPFVTSLKYPPLVEPTPGLHNYNPVPHATNVTRAKQDDECHPSQARMTDACPSGYFLVRW